MPDISLTLGTSLKSELIKIIKNFNIVGEKFTGKTSFEINWGQGKPGDILYKIELREKVDK